MPIARRSAGDARRPRAPRRATARVTSQISAASCSTQPGRGKCCVELAVGAPDEARRPRRRRGRWCRSCPGRSRGSSAGNLSGPRGQAARQVDAREVGELARRGGRSPPAMRVVARCSRSSSTSSSAQPGADGVDRHRRSPCRSRRANGSSCAQQAAAQRALAGDRRARARAPVRLADRPAREADARCPKPPPTRRANARHGEVALARLDRRRRGRPARRPRRRGRRRRAGHGRVARAARREHAPVAAVVGRAALAPPRRRTSARPRPRARSASAAVASREPLSARTRRAPGKRVAERLDRRLRSGPPRRARSTITIRSGRDGGGCSGGTAGYSAAHRRPSQTDEEGNLADDRGPHNRHRVEDRGFAGRQRRRGRHGRDPRVDEDGDAGRGRGRRHREGDQRRGGPGGQRGRHACILE